MNEQGKTLDVVIELEDSLKLVYQKPEKFTAFYSIYYGQKYADYFFRSSPATLLEMAAFLDCGYFIMNGENLIGGVFIKPNFMRDLFVVPPYDDYDGILDKLLSYLKMISKKDEKIVIREVVEECVSIYERKGCQTEEVYYWMIRPTETLDPQIPDDYLSKPVVKEDIHEIANVIMEAYLANPSMNSIEPKEFYIKHVENFLKNNQNNEIMYNSSKVILHAPTNDFVGTCLHMEFEGYPLIMSLAVKPAHQGKGIGRFLLSHSINITSKVFPATRLSVLKSNPAIKLYEKLGFIRNGSLTDMFIE